MNNTRAKPLCVRFCFLNNPSVGAVSEGAKHKAVLLSSFFLHLQGVFPPRLPQPHPLPGHSLRNGVMLPVCATIPVSSARDGPFYQAEAVAWPFHKRTQRVDLVLASVQMTIFHPKQNANGGGGGEKVRGNIVKNYLKRPQK